MKDINELQDIKSEAGIIATLIHNPDFVFHSEQLTPHDFFDHQNGLIYYAIQKLASMAEQPKIDSYNITMILNKNKATEAETQTITIENLNDLISMSEIICRNTVEEYLVLVKNVLDFSYKREMCSELNRCKELLFDEQSNTDNVQQEIVDSIENATFKYSEADDVVFLSDTIDDIWQSIQEGYTKDGVCGLPCKFPEANNYFTFENTELVLGCAIRKGGKSIWGLNEIMDKLNRGEAVVHFDTEMSDKNNAERMLSYLAKVPVRLIKSGAYGENERQRIEDAVKWIKSVKYIHKYMPSPNLNKVYSILKRMKKRNEVSFVVYDYIKSQDSNSSSEIYNIMGNICNFLKNRVAGELKLPVFALAQLNRSGDIADSFKLEQFASVVAVLQKKTMGEIIQDGERCGNYKLFIKANRLGEQMGDPETDYIDLDFNGSVVTLEQAQEQHTAHSEESPY